MINNYKQFKMDNRRIDVYPNYKNKNNINDNRRKEKSNDSKRIKNNSFLNRNDINKNNDKFIFEKTPNKNGINIKEINNRLKKKNYI